MILADVFRNTCTKCICDILIPVSLTVCVCAFAYINTKVQMSSNCICIQISCASSYYQNDFKKQSKKISNPKSNLPTSS